MREPVPMTGTKLGTPSRSPSANTHSSISTLERKLLKKPDNFVTALTSGFTNMMSHTRGLAAMIGAVVALGVLGSVYFSHKASKVAAGRNALYLAEKALEAETKALATPAATAQAGDKTKPVAPQKVLFQALNVDEKFPEAIKKLTAVTQNFSGTRADYDASFQLGRLYFNHGDSAHALTWYERAVSSAPTTFERVLAISSVGYAQENLGKSTEAIQTFQKALNLGEATLKGDLLLSMARCYEAVHDGAKARGIYDQILSELPSTDYAKTAELYKAQVK